MDDMYGGNLTIQTFYSHQDLASFFGHKPKMKIRTDKKCLLLADFNEIWVKVASLVCMNGDSLDFLF